MLFACDTVIHLHYISVEQYVIGLMDTSFVELLV